MLTARQEEILRRVVELQRETGQPVGSKTLAADPELGCGPSTVRSELACLEEHGLLAHPHTSAGRVPTDAGRRYYVDRLLPERLPEVKLQMPLVRREVDEAMRLASAALAEVSNLMAVISAPPLEAETVHRVEVLLLQESVAMVVVITSAGGVSRRLVSFTAPVDQGLAEWAGEFLNERLAGFELGARTLSQRLAEPGLGPTERSFVEALVPALADLKAESAASLYVEGAGRLLGADRLQDPGE
ncbi:MAG: heat-inducible transcription repressor HrcA, partial [Solirubrobacterales bacterium]